MQHIIKTALLFTFSMSMFAAPISHAQPHRERVLIAPSCLVQNVTASYQTLASTKQFILLSTANINGFINAKSHKIPVCGGFKDVTQAWQNAQVNKTPKAFLTMQLASAHFAPLHKVAYDIHYPKEVNQLLSQVYPQNIWNKLTKLTQYNDRYANSVANAIAILV